MSDHAEGPHCVSSERRVADAIDQLDIALSILRDRTSCVGLAYYHAQAAVDYLLEAAGNMTAAEIKQGHSNCILSGRCAISERAKPED